MTYCSDLHDLRAIDAGAELLAEVEDDLEERGLIRQMHRPYATITPAGRALLRDNKDVPANPSLPGGTMSAVTTNPQTTETETPKIGVEVVAKSATPKATAKPKATTLVEATTTSGAKIKVKPGTSQADVDKLYAKTHAATKAEQKKEEEKTMNATKPKAAAKPKTTPGLVTFTTNKRSIVAMTGDEDWAKANPAIVKALWASDKVAVAIKKEKGSQPAHTLHLKTAQAEIVLAQMKKVGVTDKHVGLLEAKLAK